MGGFDANFIISSVDVLNSIGKLNAGKGDGNSGLTTDHFINASEELSVHVSFLFSGFLYSQNCARRHVFEYSHFNS